MTVIRTQNTCAPCVGGRAARELEALLADGLGQRRRPSLPIERLAAGLGERQQRTSERGERRVARRQGPGDRLLLAGGERGAAARGEEPRPAGIVGIGGVDRVNVEPKHAAGVRSVVGVGRI